MFGIGEIVLILILAIILLGPDKLSEVARTLGKIYAEYKLAKRRLELELLYGYEIPEKKLLDILSKKRPEYLIKDEISKRITEDLILEKNLNENGKKVKGGDKKCSQ